MILIFNEQLQIIGIKNTDTQKEKHEYEWYEMYNKLLLHIENNKQLPKNTCEDEKLWYWIGTQKQKFKNGKLGQEYIDKLEEISIWWWTEIHQGYLKHKKWFEDNHKLIPKKDPTSAPLIIIQPILRSMVFLNQ